jgi:hypothetical protein
VEETNTLDTTEQIEPSTDQPQSQTADQPTSQTADKPQEPDFQDFQVADTKQFKKLIRKHCLKYWALSILTAIVILAIVYLTAPQSHHSIELNLAIGVVGFLNLLIVTIKAYLFYFKIAFISIRKSGLEVIRTKPIFKSKKLVYVKSNNVEIKITHLINYTNTDIGYIFRTGNNVIGIFNKID